jgi:protein-tyrosine phosphatase
MPRPRASDWLLEEIAGWRAEGINAVVSLLEQHEVAELELSEEPTCCRATDIEFVSFPIPDRGVPVSMRETERLVRYLSAAVADGKAVAIHCRAGIGRSSSIAACMLVLNGYDPDSAFAAIAKARGVEVPDTVLQRDWVSMFQATAAK